METLLIVLAKKFGMEKAMQLLGLDKQEQNPKYAISLGGMKLNPMNMLKRAGLNQGINSLMSGNMGSLMGPAALLGGAVMLGKAFDPMRSGSKNYNPNLRGQVDYLSGLPGMIGRDSGSGLTKYGPGSVLAGQNVASMFGTNNYLDQLNKYKNKYGKTMPKNRLDKLNKEIADYELDQVNKELKANAFKALQNINAGNNNGGGGSNIGGANEGNPSANKSAQGYSPHFARGGIANLYG